ncbi:MAG TPA: DUF308 domain-containing protein [Natronosporangium sp.]|nr:DUF308 domain-containing protein [Natronosporangium sp.]
MDGHRGRRDNGLDARDFAAVGDLDPRVGEHLLDVLGAQGIAAYLQPSMDVNPVTRDTQIPARPVDRLYADRAHLSVARDYLRRLVAEEEAAAHRAGPPGPDDTRDPAPGPVAGTPDVADPTTGPVEGRAPRSSQRPASGGPERPGRRPPAGRPPGPPPPRPPEQSSTVDATFEGIVAGFDATVAPGPAPWPAAEDLDDSGDRDDPAEVSGALPDPPPARRRRADARAFTEPSLLDALDTFGADLPDESPEERFVPPPPPPLPRLSQQAVVGTAAILIGLLLLLLPDGGPFGRSGAIVLGFLALLIGTVALILRLRPGTDPDERRPDDGAQV